MKQEVRDFLSKAEIKLVEPYLTKDQNGYEFLVIAEDTTAIEDTVTILCIDREGSPIWLYKKSLALIQPKSRSIKDGLVEGDIIINIGTQGECKVLMANQYCVILSRDNDFDKTFGNIYTYSELIGMGYTLKQ